MGRAWGLVLARDRLCRLIAAATVGGGADCAMPVRLPGLSGRCDHDLPAKPDAGGHQLFSRHRPGPAGRRL